MEIALRADRPEPSIEFVSGLTARVAASPMHVRRGSRFAFAAALAVLVVGTFLSFGGAAYAATGGSQAQASPVSNSAAADQYGDQQVASPTTPTPKGPSSAPTAPTTNVAGATASSPPTSGTLPFTGIGLGSTVLVSLSLVSLGVYLRRRESRE